jgi:hypothetical protein
MITDKDLITLDNVKSYVFYGKLSGYGITYLTKDVHTKQPYSMQSPCAVTLEFCEAANPEGRIRDDNGSIRINLRGVKCAGMPNLKSLFPSARYDGETISDNTEKESENDDEWSDFELDMWVNENEWDIFEAMMNQKLNEKRK